MSIDRRKRCSMCFSEEDITENFNFYIIGSEGIDLCQKCKLEVTKFIRVKRDEALEKYLTYNKTNNGFSSLLIKEKKNDQH